MKFWHCLVFLMIAGLLFQSIPLWAQNSSGSKNVSEETLSKLRQLKDARVKVNGLRDPNIHEPYLKEWIYLIERGVHIEALAEIDEWHLIEIVRGFKTGRFPSDFILKFSLEKELFAYSVKVAEGDPSFSKGVTWVKSYIKKKLVRCAHLERSSTDYHEDASQIENVKNVHMLFLVKRWMDFLDTKGSFALIMQLFQKCPDDNSEQGGLVFADNKAILKIIMIPRNENRITPKDAYCLPIIQGYIKHFGSIHTHLFDPEKDGRPKTISGPSGYTKYYGRQEPANSDTGAHLYYLLANPYRIDVVASQLSKKYYNIDIFFSDVVVMPDGEIKNSRTITVLDLGIFIANGESIPSDHPDAIKLNALK